LLAALTLSLSALLAAGCDPAPKTAEGGGTAPSAEATPVPETTPASGEVGPPAPPPGPPAAASGGYDTKPFKGNGKPVTTKTGLKYEDMTVGTGKEAKPGDTVVVHYTGTLENGTKFDSSRDRGEPATFSLNQVVPGFGEGIAGMKVGGRRKLTIPAKLGYGDSPPPGAPIPPGATLIFDVELIDVQ
jgi:peptidylprolyl isomerase